jgi:N-acetylmuramoyl-L-alanine amidase
MATAVGMASLLLALVAMYPMSSLADITGMLPETGACLCAVETAARATNITCTLFLRALKAGQCYKFAGLKDTCHRRGNDFELFLIDDGRGDSWVSGDQVTLGDESSCRTNEMTDDCPRIVSRAEWEARPPRSTEKIKQPIPRVFIHHTDTQPCTNQSACSTVVRSIQKYHMNTQGWGDIGYHFLVGEDGNVYEGRGWDNVGAQVKGYNYVSLGFAVIGTYTDHLPLDRALSAVQKLIACSVTKGKLATNYTLHGHRDGGRTTCPGQKLYDLIRTWPHYGGPLPVHRWTPRLPTQQLSGGRL